MDETLQQVSIERAHMAATHQALDRVLQRAKKDGRPFPDFYRSCAEYLEFIMGRFHAQDQGHLDDVKPLVPKEEVESWKLLNEVEAAFKKGKGEVAKLIAAMQRFQDQGPDGCAEFEEVARAYADFFKQQTAKLKHSIRYLMAEHLTPEQFRANSNVTEESIRKEKELFAKLESSMPEGMKVEVHLERPEDAPAPPHQED